MDMRHVDIRLSSVADTRHLIFRLSGAMDMRYVIFRISSVVDSSSAYRVWWIRGTTSSFASAEHIGIRHLLFV
jgi:hypothetical protein